MSNIFEGQTMSDKRYQFYGSNRVYYSGVPLGSTTAWYWINPSGTDKGFGTNNNILCNRIQLVSSGTSVMQWSYNSGLTIAGDLWGGNATSQDGVNVSGLWVRSDVGAASSQKFQAWFW